MKTTLSISLFLLSIFGSIFCEKKCEISGVYRVFYENDLENSITKIEFNDSVYYRTFELGKTKGIISKIYNDNNNCVYYLKDVVDQKANSTRISQIETDSDFIKKIKTLGEPIMEISGPFGDTINFKVVYSRQLHVQISQGKLIKQ